MLDDAEKISYSPVAAAKWNSMNRKERRARARMVKGSTHPRNIASQKPVKRNG